MRYPHHIKIYKKRWHLVVTFLTIVLPIVFIFVFSKIGGISAGGVFVDIGASFVRVIFAYIISVALAIVFSLLLGSAKAEAFFLPLFDVLQSFPSFALLPIFSIWFGVGNITAILFLVMTMVWPILFSTLSSLHMVREDLKEASFVFGAQGGIKKLLHFTVPGGFLNKASMDGNIPILTFGIIALLLILFSMNKLIWLPLLKQSHDYSHE
ncbi:MAG: Nitrate/sulfonate/bicarbonate ABC transporter permease [Parcubacteria group bacterium GW2011_GWA2_47_10]|nr:MAG: Nitrate/sulfonate/bicarbonate ABC transporter permease [Parcubacteria group bacterium GW2011_GWA2_47_10]